MELSQLRAFVEIAKVGQLTRAAERLHLSQPALSGQLKALEESLGVSLFERSSSGMALTASGRSLLAEAESVLAGIQQLKQTAQHLQGRLAGHGQRIVASSRMLGRRRAPPQTPAFSMVHCTI